MVELHPGQASYLPLQEYERLENGEDPLLGLLGALDALPSDLRAIAQIALVPAPPTWSQPYQRKALEHALEPERQQDRRNQVAAHDEGGAPSTALLVIGALFLAGYFLLQRFPEIAACLGTCNITIAAAWAMATGLVRATSPGNRRHHRRIGSASSSPPVPAATLVASLSDAHV